MICLFIPFFGPIRGGDFFVRLPEDVLFLPSSKLRGFEGLSPGEAEAVLTMLLAPYLRIPLLLGYLGTVARALATG